MKMYYQLNKDKLLEKAKNRYHNGGTKEKTAEYYKDNKEVLKENAKSTYIETYLRKKKKQKELMEEIDTEIGQKIKRIN